MADRQEEGSSPRAEVRTVPTSEMGGSTGAASALAVSGPVSGGELAAADARRTVEDGLSAGRAPRADGSAGSTQGSAKRSPPMEEALRRLQEVVVALKEVTEELEEAAELLDMAVEQKEEMNREIDRLNRLINQLQRPREGYRPPGTR